MELQTMITVMKNVNLCTYFMLPLLGLSEHSFGERNFINSYISRDGDCIYVRVYSKHLLPSSIRSGNNLVTTLFDEEYLVLPFPPLWREDIEKFLNGKYSQMSLPAKELIVQHSGLEYKAKGESGTQLTDFRLIALTRHPNLLAYIKDALYDPGEYCILDEDETTELLEAPGDYMYFREPIVKEETL